MWLDSSSVDGDGDDDDIDDGDEREGGSIPSCIKCQLNQQVPTSFILGGGDDRKKTVMMIMAVTKAMMMMVVMRMMLTVVISRAFVISQLAPGTKGTKGGQMLKLHETLQFTLQSRENPPHKVDLQNKHCFS